MGIPGGRLTEVMSSCHTADGMPEISIPCIPANADGVPERHAPVKGDDATNEYVTRAKTFLCEK
ncbi:MAG: hypothetical protein R3D26_12075 [Cyanobacteriota/Melainabacteria group bacterium]